MFRTATLIIKVLFYGLIILAGVVFAVSNRGMVDFTFYPIPYAFSLPLFLFTIIIFTIGLGAGWFIAHLKVFGQRRAQKEAIRRIEALENELGTLRTEQMVRPPMAALPLK